MRKKILIVLPVFTLLLFISCSKDKEASPAVQEEQEQEITEPPSNFLISIEPSFGTATVEWTVSEGANNENLLYSLFIDNELVEEGITLTNYLIRDLEFSSSYSLRVVAKNEFGETAVEDSFQTLNPENYTVRVDTIKYGESSNFFKFYYDDSLRLIEGKFWQDAYNNFDDRSDFTYDNNGNFNYQKYDWYYNSVDHEVFMSLDNDEFLSYEYRRNDFYTDQWWAYFFEFTSQTTYNVSVRYNDQFELYWTYYTINLELDSENRIIYYERINLETNEIVNALEFEYTNENLTKVIGLNEGAVYEMEYDDKKYYYGTESFANKGLVFFRDLLPDSGTQYNPKNERYYIPRLNLFVNKNNLLKIYKNGQIIPQTFFDYEYNELDYPVKKIDIGGYFIEFIYSYIEN